MTSQRPLKRQGTTPMVSVLRIDSNLAHLCSGCVPACVLMFGNVQRLGPKNQSKSGGSYGNVRVHPGTVAHPVGGADLCIQTWLNSAASRFRFRRRFRLVL